MNTNDAFRASRSPSARSRARRARGVSTARARRARRNDDASRSCARGLAERQRESSGEDVSSRGSLGVVGGFTGGRDSREGASGGARLLGTRTLGGGS